MRGSLLLLQTMLRATGRWNIYRHTADEKLRRKIVMGCVGLVVLYAMLVFYSGAMAFGYGSIGLRDVVPGVCALTISALAFIMTIFRTNGYLFRFREYDMVMSLPFSARTVALSKFLLREKFSPVLVDFCSRRMQESGTPFSMHMREKTTASGS